MKGFRVDRLTFPNSMQGEHSTDLSDLQRRLLHSHVHTLPGAAKHLPPSAPFTTLWGGGIYLVSLLGGLPGPLLTWWAAQPAGHILLTDGEAGYALGELAVGDLALRDVSRIPLDRLIQDPLAGLALAVQPLDHLLGCGGDEAGRWLSDGGGITPAWQEIGRQIHSLFGLGYGLTEAAQKSPQAYLAQGLVLALHQPRRLNTQDPKLDRLLRGSLLNEGFCRRWLS